MKKCNGCYAEKLINCEERSKWSRKRSASLRESRNFQMLNSSTPNSTMLM